VDGYDTRTAAHRINALVQALGVSRHLYVGHDIGAWVGYPYAHTFEQELGGIVFLDGNIPGVTLQPTLRIAEPDYWRSWHFLFNMVEVSDCPLLGGGGVTLLPGGGETMKIRAPMARRLTPTEHSGTTPQCASRVRR
jgi:pimeloyl-ACP methyl ester carboxylesterase